MDKFTASNGYTVNGYTSSIIIRDRGGFVANDLGKYSAGAMREFVQSERDEELGRWRWPENPDYVVYPHGNDTVRVIDERSAVAETLYRAGDERQPLLATGGGMDAARAYFTAHPERKPWHDADAGEVWMFGDEHNPNLVLAWRAREGWDVIGPNQEVVSGVNDPVVWTASIGRGEIADGRRILSKDAP